MSYPKNKSYGLIKGLLFGLVLVASLLFIANRQRVIDQISVWQYQPSAQVSALIDEAGMNENGRFIYLASQPKLEPTTNVNKVCGTAENTTSILGCYRDSRIYISDVTNAQLDGIKQVTAAHETLHGIYERLDDSERVKVNKLLEAEYKKLDDNKDFADLIAYYSKAEPGQRANELHSLIGTEIANLNPELESYYSKYFSNRQKVVVLNSKYSGVFKALEAKRKLLADQLNGLQASITVRSAQYNTDVQRLNADIVAFNEKANSGSFSSMSEFYYERSILTTRVAELEANRQSINDDTNTYETLRSEYNSIVSQSNKLYDSIKSTLTPAQSI